MDIITNKTYSSFNREEQNEYLTSYVQSLLANSIMKTQCSDSYDMPCWPYFQADQLGQQKILNKILRLIKI